MSRTAAVAWVLAVLAVFAVIGIVGEHYSSQQQSHPTVYVVQRGDTLWSLSKFYLGDPYRYKEVVAKNTILQQPGREYVNVRGLQIVRIWPKEKLYGLINDPVPPTPFYQSWMSWLFVALALVALALWLLYGTHIAGRRRGRIVNPAVAAPSRVASEHLRSVG